MSDRAIISGAVEGPVDEAVLRRLVQDAGGMVGKVYGLQGKERLIRQLGAYNYAARRSPWVVLMDFDREPECLPSYHRTLLPNPSSSLCFRLAVRAVEAWLLADRQRFGMFFGVSEARLPLNPDELPNPKSALVGIAHHSRKKEIRESLVPRADSGRLVGPGYSSWIISYIQDRDKGWRPDVAAGSSDSLARCKACIFRLLREPGASGRRPRSEGG
jgi:hypothetical protein